MGNLHGHFKYGQRFYDFKEGGLCFVSPNQAIANYDVNEGHSGYMLLVHPDFLLNYPLMRKIKQYGFSLMPWMKRCIFRQGEGNHHCYL